MLGNLPPKCYRDAERLNKRPVRTHLEKGNLQIKSTEEPEQKIGSARRTATASNAPEKSLVEMTETELLELLPVIQRELRLFHHIRRQGHNRI